VSTTEQAPEAEGQDYTVDHENVTPGTVVFRHGYIPVVVFDSQDGKLEVAEFQSFRWEDASDFSTHRGPRPAVTLPAEAAPADRVAALEEQVATLTKLLSKQLGDEAPTPGGVTPPAEPQPGGSPFGEVS
jgi:hypothetical protein